MSTILQDLRYGLRMLAKNPGFTAVAVITLGLGIAANTAIFSVVSGVLLRKPPVRDPDRVMVILSINRAKGWGDSPEHPVSAPVWRRVSRIQRPSLLDLCPCPDPYCYCRTPSQLHSGVAGDQGRSHGGAQIRIVNYEC